MKKRNILLAVLLLAAGLLWLFFRPGDMSTYAVVAVDGRDVGRYSLDTDLTITVGAGVDAYNILCISDGNASIIEASCDDQDCVHTKAVSQDKEAILCLPHHLTVRIEGGEARGFGVG